MDEKQAIPKAELFRRLSDSSYPKTELEHFAWGLYWDCAEDNTKLRAENERLKADAEGKKMSKSLGNVVIDGVQYSMGDLRQIIAENERLKADVDRWRKQVTSFGSLS